jgi:hypothetical protein
MTPPFFPYIFTVASDGEEGLLVVMCGNVEHEHVGPANGSCEHASVSIKT